MVCKQYTIKHLSEDLDDIWQPDVWNLIEPLEIKDYLWMDNKYRPVVLVKLCYTENYIFAKFLVNEKKVKAVYKNYGDPVYKDSCVEFFINPFPNHSEDYINIEVNAIGTLLIGAGKDRNRTLFKKGELGDLQIVSSLDSSVADTFESESWTLYMKLPIDFFENYYAERFIKERAIGNFYKCGDETEFEHYGVWNYIHNPEPDFHLQQYFGELIFEK